MANRVLCTNGCCFECDECSSKPGSPVLCQDCIQRRDECWKKHAGEKPNPSPMWKSEDEESQANDGRGTANSRQVAGDHYRLKEGEQHWDRAWRLYGAAPFQYQITKYVERYKDKNGLQDLEKARHFLDKLIELETEKLKKEKEDA